MVLVSKAALNVLLIQSIVVVFSALSVSMDQLVFFPLKRVSVFVLQLNECEAFVAW